MTTRVTTWQDLASLADGQAVEVEGRYEIRPVDMRPPGEEVVTASVILQGGPGVLIGAYGTIECVRPVEERSRLRGQRVRVAGTFRRSAPWPEGAPMPGQWTGGGPQVVDVGPVDAAG